MIKVPPPSPRFIVTSYSQPVAPDTDDESATPTTARVGTSARAPRSGRGACARPRPCPGGSATRSTGASDPTPSTATTPPPSTAATPLHSTAAEEELREVFSLLIQLPLPSHAKNSILCVSSALPPQPSQPMERLDLKHHHEIGTVSAHGTSRLELSEELQGLTTILTNLFFKFLLRSSHSYKANF